jgi:hypothetical protein
MCRSREVAMQIFALDLFHATSLLSKLGFERRG